MPTSRQKPDLGHRYTCFTCQTKFYDLNRPVATCPDCGADQAEAPVTKLELSSGRKRRRAPVEPVLLEDDDDSDEDDDLDADDEDDDLLGGDDDGDDSDDD